MVFRAPTVISGPRIRHLIYTNARNNRRYNCLFSQQGLSSTHANSSRAACADAGKRPIINNCSSDNDPT